MPQPLRATCLGLVCPVGLTAASACAAIRAGLDGFGEVGYLDDSGDAVMGAVVPVLEDDLRGRARLATLLALAMEDALARLPRDLHLGEVPLLLCVREPERPGPRIKGLVVEVERRLSVRFRRDQSATVAQGHVSAFGALAIARDLLSDGRADSVLIAAADSFIDARTLLWLHRHRRLKTVANSDGVIPGEAAGVILVSTGQVTPGGGVRILGLGFGHESATVHNEEPLLGLGMAEAVRAALQEAGAAMHDIDLRLSDVAGESYGFEELSLAQSRLMRQRREEQPLWHSAGALGDCGAAAGIAQIAWFEEATQRGYAPGRLSLGQTSALAGPRAAAVMSS
jgi:3-oxoacyl-[acyl-carrier-protein] synthase-1